MLRLQHYIELCYIVFGAFVLFDAVRMIKWRMRPKLCDVARVFGLLAICPLVAVWMAANFVREQW